MKKFSFDINGQKFEVNVKGIEGDMAELEVNGTPYSVKMNKEVKVTKTPTLVRSAVSNADAPKVAGEKMAPVASSSKPSGKAIKSPLPGNVLKINVAAGDSFKDGDVLMVMESMKMEMPVEADASGTVSSVSAAVGDTVAKGHTLVVID